MEISVSILNLKEKNRLKELEQTNPNYIHIDVMDGKFVENTSFPIEEVREFIDGYNYDVHLMVNDVKKYIDEFKSINPKYITFHIEADNILENINYLKSQNIKVGLAINPNTNIGALIPYLDVIDLVLVMSVKPGAGGQEFIMHTLDKINTLYEYRRLNNLNFKISVDGGVNDKTASYLKKCDIIVSGSFITSGDFKENMNKLRSVI